MDSSWDILLTSEQTSIGVVKDVRVLMKKPASGAGLLVRSPSSYLPPGSLRPRALQDQTPPPGSFDENRRAA